MLEISEYVINLQVKLDEYFQHLTTYFVYKYRARVAQLVM